MARADFRVALSAISPSGEFMLLPEFRIAPSPRCSHAVLIEVREQFVQLRHQEVLTRHGIQKPIDTVENHKAKLAIFNRRAYLLNEITD